MITEQDIFKIAIALLEEHLIIKELEGEVVALKAKIKQLESERKAKMKISINIKRNGDNIEVYTKAVQDEVWSQLWNGPIPDNTNKILDVEIGN